MNPLDALNLGDPLPDVFPPDDPIARFVVSMAMASNDIERALRDVQRAGENDDPDFTYRIRLSVGHLVEALDALSSYSQEFGDIRSLINRIPPAGQKHLSEARGTIQRAGSRVLKNVRDNTFHYPSPERRYSRRRTRSYATRSGRWPIVEPSFSSMSRPERSHTRSRTTSHWR